MLKLFFLLNYFTQKKRIAHIHLHTHTHPERKVVNLLLIECAAGAEMRSVMCGIRCCSGSIYHLIKVLTLSLSRWRHIFPWRFEASVLEILSASALRRHSSLVSVFPAENISINHGFVLKRAVLGLASKNYARSTQLVIGDEIFFLLETPNCSSMFSVIFKRCFKTIYKVCSNFNNFNNGFSSSLLDGLMGIQLLHNFCGKVNSKLKQDEQI